MKKYAYLIPILIYVAASQPNELVLKKDYMQEQFNKFFFT